MIKTIFISSLLISFGCNASTDMLSSWNETPAKQSIELWVQNATKEGSPTFIPADKRYVVFDNDGTLWPEEPLVFQIRFIFDEIKRQAPEYPEWGKDPLLKAVMNNDLKTVATFGDAGLMKLVGLSQGNMTTDEFSKRVENWFDTHKDPRFGCRYDQMGYQPMRQLLDYLRENGFKTWIVSGGSTDFMRVVSQKMYGIPPEQVVGTFAPGEFSQTNNGTQIRNTMKGIFYNDGAAKPVAIHMFMGHRSVGAFGNSDSDLQMLEYTATNPDYKTFGLLVHHTDAAREYAYDKNPGYGGKLTEGLTEAKSKGWTVVDMKQDWKTVFDPAQCPVN